jgi:hypothetical protein
MVIAHPSELWLLFRFDEKEGDVRMSSWQSSSVSSPEWQIWNAADWRGLVFTS